MSGEYEIHLQPDGTQYVDFKDIHYNIIQSKNRIIAIQKQKDILDVKRRLSCELESYQRLEVCSLDERRNSARERDKVFSST